VVFVEAVVGQMDVGVVEILFCGLLVVLAAEAGETLFIEIAYVGFD
jgi:hypothetical protein